MVAQQTRDYELVMVLSPEATEEEIGSTMERVDGLITDSGGSVGDHKFQEGNYVLTRFALGPQEFKEVNRLLNASEDILRFLVTTV